MFEGSTTPASVNPFINISPSLPHPRTASFLSLSIRFSPSAKIFEAMIAAAKDVRPAVDAARFAENGARNRKGPPRDAAPRSKSDSMSFEQPGRYVRLRAIRFPAIIGGFEECRKGRRFAKTYWRP